MSADKYLVRWLRKMLSLRFVQAAPNKSFNIKLSTIIENSGVSLYARLSDNLKQVEQALVAMDDMVARYCIEKSYTVHPETGRGRVLADAKVILWPTNEFATQQIKTNLHAQDLDGGVITREGDVMLEPQREDYESFKAYETARITYLRGIKVPKTVPKAQPDQQC
jgi:hypothetical protein